MGLPNFMKFHHCLFKVLKNKTVADKWMDGQREKQYTPTNTVCWGYKQYKNN